MTRLSIDPAGSPVADPTRLSDQRENQVSARRRRRAALQSQRAARVRPGREREVTSRKGSTSLQARGLSGRLSGRSEARRTQPFRVHAKRNPRAGRKTQIKHVCVAQPFPSGRPALRSRLAFPARRRRLWLTATTKASSPSLLNRRFNRDVIWITSSAPIP